ncbi:MAG: metalloregulator ArsR/SmtB family transcription factor [Patescibacteria group bacterium]
MLTKEQIKKIKIDTAEQNDEYALVFEALGEHGRFRIFRLLMDHQELCVTDVAEIFGITVSAASQQLKILERVGLVERMRMGQMVCYEIKNSMIARHIKKLLKDN